MRRGRKKRGKPAPVPRAELDALRERTKLSDTIGRTLKLSPRGPDFIGLCPFHTEKTPSFTVHDKGGFWKCFGCGEGGDVFAWIQAIEKVGFNEAVRRLKGGTDPVAVATATEITKKRHARDAEAQRKRARSIDLARNIWRGTKPAAGTIVETYLRSRAIAMPPPATLRFHPCLGYKDPDKDLTIFLPAMVAPVQDANGDLCGIHRTYIARDGSGKADVASPKKMLGAVRGAAVRFARPEYVLDLGEGIESTLSVVSAFYTAGEAIAAWAVLSLSNFDIAVPRQVHTLRIWRDGDEKNRAEADATLKKQLKRHTAEGRRVLIIPPDDGMDFNDMLRGGNRPPSPAPEGVPF